MGICLDRPPQMLIGILATLKAGGAYLPLEPTYPEKRLAVMLRDAKAPFVLTEEKSKGRLPGTGIRIVCLDSDGYVAELMPLWIEAGFNCTFPVEVAAGNDIEAYRAQYGTEMAFLGGIDKRALAAGGDVMRREVMRVAPVIEGGGCIPGCDHGVPADISWPNFVEYTRLLAHLTGWL